MALTRINNNSLSAVTAAALPTGTIVQVQEALKTDKHVEVISARSVGSDIPGLSVTITPKSATNKLLVMMTLHMANGTSGYRCAAVIYRDGSPSSFVGDSEGSRTPVTIGRSDAPDSQNMMFNTSFTGAVSAGTTNSTTFTVRLHNAAEGVTSTMLVNRQNEDSDVNYNTRAVSSLIVMEIAG